MMEYFAADGSQTPASLCIRKAADADVVVVILARRYGWIPPDQPKPHKGPRKSITWLECEAAIEARKEVLAFVLDDSAEWPPELNEEHRLIEKLLLGKANQSLLAKVNESMTGLRHFKDWLGERSVYAKFSKPAELEARVLQSLHEWKQRSRRSNTKRPTTIWDPYLRAVLLRTERLEIRGLYRDDRRAGGAGDFNIESLFMSLTASLDSPSIRRLADDSAENPPGHTQLHLALGHRCLVVLGHPGAGKTTFIKRVAYALTQTLLGDVPTAARDRLDIRDAPTPLLISLPELGAFLEGDEPSSRNLRQEQHDVFLTRTSRNQKGV